MKRPQALAHIIYFVGVGGIGMSALARYFLAVKARRANHRDDGPQWTIAGSDAVQSSITKDLVKEGVNVKIGHKKGHITGRIAFVVYNRAIPKNNPELVEARRRKIPIIPYAEVLGEVTKTYTTIAITGSHGKTTTTAFAGLMLAKSNFDPTIFIGSKLKELGGKNIRIGTSEYLVLEADDFGGAFLEYAPKIAIVTNIDREHLDFYKTFGNLKNAFLGFIANIQAGGSAILNRDDKNLYSLRPRIAAIAKRNHVTITWYSLREPSALRIKKSLKIAGKHNASNALAAYHLGALLNISEKNIVASLGTYHGAWRRMEYRGMFEGHVQVFDDYAHHPTEIRATLQAFREKFPHSPLVCVFQPHQTKRLEALFREFQSAFQEADITVILPIYKVKGRNERASVDAEALAKAIQSRYPKKEIYYLGAAKKIKMFLREILQKPGTVASRLSTQSPVVIMMGAGDIVDTTDSLVS